ncbi:MAG: methyltransferase [Deltaproteobacteria bacterium]|nr:methyltransferase [Deltaproteobacteria bacterium]
MNIHRLSRNVRRILFDARIRVTPLPLCPGIRLHLISPENMTRPFSPEETRRIITDTPYWGFCWASGQALASALLRDPGWVCGKSVLDFGAGSGVVAVAAAMAGAGEVLACDRDPGSIEAVRANAALNGVDVRTCPSLDALPKDLDVILAADILYDRDNLPYLEILMNHAPEILVAESRVKNIDLHPYRKIMEMESSTLPDLDRFDPYRRVRIYRAMSSGD